MLTSGIISLLLVLFSLIAILIFKNQIKKYSFKYSFIIYLVSIFCLLYFLIARYIPDLIDLIKYQNINNNLNEYQNYLKAVYLSKALLLDACPFIAMFLPLSIIFNKQMDAAKHLAPLGIIGSCVTIFGQVIWDDIAMNDYLKYLFIGMVPNRLYFMMHWLSLLLSLYVLILCKHFNLKDLIFTFAFYIIWFVYMVILVLSFDIKYNATGLVANDWLDPIYGEYYKVYTFWKLPYPIITLFWYVIAIIVNYLIISIKNFKVIKEFLIKHRNKQKKLIENN